MLFVGRFVESKGAHTVVAAMPEILARHPDARLFLVGHGPARGLLEEQAAALGLGRDHIIFTGYLTHPRLRHLFACADVAVFPSLVAEAGPLVFLEALASGCFPIGTYFGGMAASIDTVSAGLPAADRDLMKLRREPEHLVADIAHHTIGALALDGRHRATLRQVAEDRFDWQSVAARLAAELGAIRES